MIAAGLQPAERVCALDTGQDALIEVLFGVAKAGGVFTPLNWRLTASEVASAIHDAQPAVIFVGEAFADRLSEVDVSRLRRVVRWGAGPERWIAYDAFRESGAATDPKRDNDPSATAWLLYTSGTTALPKGVELSHANLCDQAILGPLAYGPVAAGETALICMPLYHIAGLGYMLTTLFAGLRLIVTREVDPTEILALIESEQINHTFLVPAILHLLLGHPSCATTDLSSLKGIFYGGSPISDELLSACLATFGCRFIQGYGLTETSGAVLLLSASEHVSGSPRLPSCGLPFFGRDLKIVSSDGCECGVGVVGELAIRGPMVMKGYYRQPRATAEALREGWFHTGDAGYRDEDGYVFIVDRIKDIIVSGAENIYPGEVETALLQHPGVREAAVFGIPHERWGESVKAVVACDLNTIRKTLSEAELIAFCKTRLAPYKCPKSVDFVEALPRNATGKVLRRALREPHWRGHGRRVG